MSNFEKNAEQFAISLISLALVRNGYRTCNEVEVEGSARADILAALGDETGERFVVEVKAIRDRRSLPQQLDSLREKYRSLFGVSAFLAFFIDQDDLLLVDEQLEKRMRFSDDEVSLEVIGQEAFAADFEVPK